MKGEHLVEGGVVVGEGVKEVTAPKSLHPHPWSEDPESSHPEKDPCSPCQDQPVQSLRNQKPAVQLAVPDVVATEEQRATSGLRLCMIDR